MTSRFDYDHEEFMRRMAEDPASGYPPDFPNWPPEARRSWIAANTEAILAESDHLVGRASLADGPDDFGTDWADWEAPTPKNGDGRARDGYEAHPPLPVLKGLNPADWQGKKAPLRLWDIPGYIPHGVPALLYADGGTGKGFLALQLAVARALSKEWIGLLPEPGRTMVLSTEDDYDEMWRRLEGMLPFYGAEMKDLSDIRLLDLVGENSVLGLLSKGIIEPTPMYQALDAYIGDFKPGMVVLDVLADLFSGEESNRPQVTQFIGLLKRLCRKHDCTLLLSAQPSIAGMSTGTGTSGSTAWHNSVRARMYFNRVRTPDGEELNKDLRTFQGMKNNYGEVGGKFDLVFEKGLFQRLSGPSGFDKLAVEQRAMDIFLDLLKRFTEQNRPVGISPGKAYAPALFAAEREAKGISSKYFHAAMIELLRLGKIAYELETDGPPSKRKTRLVIK